MLRHAGAPRALVEFALVHATMLLNRLPRARKGERELVVPLHRWLGMAPPSVLHVLKVWGCTAYALVHTGREKFDSKAVRLIHLGYDVARSAYILCSLPHFKISYSAHVTFNEDDFPLRAAYQPDPLPSSLFEESHSRVNQEGVGGDWGRVVDIPRGPDEGREAPRPTMAGRPVVSSWTAQAEARNVLSGTAQADEPHAGSETTFQRGQDAGRSATRDIRVGERSGAGGATATASRTSGPSGRAIPPGAPDGGGLGVNTNRSPSIGGGVRALEGTVRRSGRGWKPSAGCLESIAHVTRELASVEGDLAESFIGEHPEWTKEGQEFTQGAAMEHTFWLRECSYASQGVELCPRSHGEAMLLPYAQKVRDAEIDEFNSHVVNGTFGPPLDENDFAAGPPLKAVWVYSRSKKDPDSFKAVMRQVYISMTSMRLSLQSHLLELSWLRLHVLAATWSTGMSRRLSLRRTWIALSTLPCRKLLTRMGHCNKGRDGAHLGTGCLRSSQGAHKVLGYGMRTFSLSLSSKGLPRLPHRRSAY